MKEIRVFRLPDGYSPYLEWLSCLKYSTRMRINAYVDRVSSGGSRKNVRSIGDQVFEIKIDTGPGYRVYFGIDGQTIILLFCGGHKGSQIRDILRAKNYWRIYRESK